jgi:prepilin-type N-terminal cleavage/methylation domain-containing protein
MNARRDGFSMVEVLLAMTLLAIILTSMAGFTFTTARSAIVAGDATAREALMLETVNRFDALPFDQLVAQAGCTTLGPARNAYRRCVDVTVAANDASATVVVTVTPQQRGVPATSTRFLRPGPPPPSPLCISGDCSP